MFHKMPLEMYFMKYSERKVSQCILTLTSTSSGKTLLHFYASKSWNFFQSNINSITGGEKSIFDFKHLTDKCLKNDLQQFMEDAGIIVDYYSSSYKICNETVCA